MVIPALLNRTPTSGLLALAVLAAGPVSVAGAPGPAHPPERTVDEPDAPTVSGASADTLVVTGQVHRTAHANLPAGALS